MARWTRAIKRLTISHGSVLDLGCAFGFTTRMLRRRGYDAVGVDASADYIRRARRSDPLGTYLVADAAHVPLPDSSFDGALLLDVLEHLPDAQAAVNELARLVKPGATLVVSVPHRGMLAACDSLNLFAKIVRLTGHGRFPPEIDTTGIHRHYSIDELSKLLAPHFAIRRTERTGLGLAELIHLPILLLFRWLVPVEAMYQAAAFVYYAAYLVEDIVPLGPAGYHLMVTATRRGSD